MEEAIRKINLSIVQAEYYGLDSIIERIEIKTLKDILNRLDRLQKENKELKKGQNSLMQSRKKWKDRYYREKVAKEEVEELLENSIPKEKIENKIKELNNKIEQYREYFIVNKETDVEYYENITNLEKVRILKELLEEEK